MDNEQLTKNFWRSEFACQDNCGRDGISGDLVSRLQEVRDALGLSIRITSGTRCKKHNENVGGSSKSSHLPDEFGISYAVDIACDSSSYRQKLLSAITPVFDRVGIAKTFIHVDVDPSKSAGVMWLYS